MDKSTAMPVEKIKKFSLKYFKFIYISGILVAIVIALSGNIFEIIPDLSKYILSVSLGHMIVLVCLGFSSYKFIRSDFGSRIQTAGYLHTLIGFSAALLKISEIDPSDFKMVSILAPIGSALTTSIIGWLFGGEIYSKFKDEDDKKSLQTEFERITAEIDGFITHLRRLHESYSTTLKMTIDAYNNLHANQKKISDSQIEILNKSLDIAENINAKMNSIQKTIKKIDSDLKSISKHDLNINVIQLKKELEKTTEFAKKLGENLSNARLLFKGLEDLMKTISSNKRI